MLKHAALALSASFIVMPSGQATTGCPVSDCPSDYLVVKSPDRVERGDPARIKVRIDNAEGEEPRGRVTVTVVRAKGGFTWTDTKKYRGEQLRFRTPQLDKRGSHVVKARFDAKPDTDSKDMDNRDEFRVIKPE